MPTPFACDEKTRNCATCAGGAVGCVESRHPCHGCHWVCIVNVTGECAKGLTLPGITGQVDFDEELRFAKYYD